jgi:hypothetical protein
MPEIFVRIRRPQSGYLALCGDTEPRSAWSHPLSMPSYLTQNPCYGETRCKVVTHAPSSLGSLGSTQESLCMNAISI